MNFLAYFETLPMWFQLFVIFGGLVIAGTIFVAISWRMWHYGLKIKAGSIEIDATEENEKEVQNVRQAE